jgi:hypothetical protein
LPALLVLILLAVPREGHASSAFHARSPGAPLTGVAGWTGGFLSFNVLSAPWPDAPVVATLQPGERVRVLRSVQGSPGDGVGLWYQLQLVQVLFGTSAIRHRPSAAELRQVIAHLLHTSGRVKASSCVAPGRRPCSEGRDA